MRSHSWSCAALIPLLACLLSCAMLPVGPRAIRDCEGPLASTDSIEGDFVLRHRLRVNAGGTSFPLETITQKRAGELVVVGINPFGAKLFTLIQLGDEIEVDALPPAVLPIPPLNLLRDLHRVLFLKAVPPASGAGESALELATEQIFEVWRGGEIESRSFLAKDRPPVRLEFSKQNGKQRVWLRNPYCRYELELDSISAQPL